MKISGAKKERVKTALLENQRGLCAYCGKRITISNSTIDHIIPQCKGGTWAKTNLALSHKYCNHLKGSVIIPQQILEDKPKLYSLFLTKQIHTLRG